jgi:hypothetical protein
MPARGGGTGHHESGNDVGSLGTSRHVLGRIHPGPDAGS